MNVPQPLEVTSRLMAGYRFSDGSLIEVDDTGDYIITDKDGNILDDTMLHGGGGGMRSGTMGWVDYGEIMDDLAAFLMHDADLYDAMVMDYDDWSHVEGDLIFSLDVAEWANTHNDELSILACYREDQRLENEED